MVDIPSASTALDESIPFHSHPGPSAKSAGVVLVKKEAGHRQIPSQDPQLTKTRPVPKAGRAANTYPFVCIN